MESYDSLAQRIIDDVGGLGNVAEVTHCFTRLRFKLKDPSLVNEDDLKGRKEIAGTVHANGIFQVIVGNDINAVYQAVSRIVGAGGAGAGAGEPAAPVQRDWRYWLNLPLNTMSATITPILVGLVVTGLYKALLSIVVLLGLIDTAGQTYALLNMMGDTFFYFMPFIVAYSASQHFHCNSVVSLMLAGILMHPTFTALVDAGNAVSFFGLPVHAISYSSSLLPMLFTIWIQSKVEMIVNRTPVRKLGLLLSQLPVFVVMAPVTLMITGPVGSIIGEVIATAMLALYENYYVLGVFAVCFLMPIFILTGSHWVLMPTALANLDKLGFDPFLWVGFAVINFSQLAVALAIFLKARDKDLKSFAGSAVLPIATAGITEPCMFGLTLKLKRPLVATFIGCAAGGLFCGLAGVKVYELVTVSLVSLPQFIDPAGGNNFMVALVGMAITFAVTFAATWLIGFDEGDFEN